MDKSTQAASQAQNRIGEFSKSDSAWRSIIRIPSIELHLLRDELIMLQNLFEMHVKW